MAPVASGPSEQPEQPRRVFTIGHSNHPIDHFVGLLRTHGVHLVADVRSMPRSRFAPQFNRAQLDASLRGAGIRYVFLGAELGGRPDDDGFYDDGGRVRYDLLAESDAFTRAIGQLIAETGPHRVAVMCAEENPESCHRRLLVGRVLLARGHRVTHIRGDARATEDDVSRFLVSGHQHDLFGETSELSWRSVRPIRAR